MNRASSISFLFATSCAAATVESEPAVTPSAQANTRAPASTSTLDDPPTTPTHVEAPPPESPYAGVLREVATSFTTWGMVDSQLHWAPGLCALPAEGVEHMSVAEAEAAHADKVFRLYALDAMKYWKATDAKGKLPSSLADSGRLTSRTDVVQVLVKESFAAVPAGSGQSDFRIISARKGNVSYAAGDPIGLFVMAQLRDPPEDTDEGWIYATIAPGGEITSAGVLAACRDCHAKQADRVFGMPLHWKK